MLASPPTRTLNHKYLQLETTEIKLVGSMFILILEMLYVCWCVCECVPIVSFLEHVTS